MNALVSPDRPLGFAGITLLGALSMVAATKPQLLCSLICFHGQNHAFSALSQICGG